MKSRKGKFSQESLIASAGFESESHYVETEDGYKLKIHRIRPKISLNKSLAPVFIMHGLFATSADYLMTGPDKALRNDNRICVSRNVVTYSFF